MRERDISNLFIATFLMAACILWPKKTAKNDGRNPQDHTEANTYQRQSAIGSVSNERQNGNKPNEHESIERRYWKRQNQLGCTGVFVNFLILVAAVFAFAAAWNAYVIGTDSLREARNQTEQARRQARAAENQVRIQIDTENRQLRAYVYVTPDGIKNLGTTENPEGGATINMIGQTPAYDVRFFTSIATLPYPLTEDIDKYLPTGSTEVIRSVLFPGVKFSNSPKLTYVPSPERLQVIKDGKRFRFYVWGRVLYKDAFDIPRWVLFCFNYDGALFNKGAPAEICNQHVGSN